MREFSQAFAAHISGEATTLCYCWIVTRKDGAKLGFTNHDRDIVLGDIVCAAQSGFSAFDVESHLGLALDNTEISGAISAEAIVESDIRTGKYDGAALEVWQVNWRDPGIHAALWRGFIGQISLEQGRFQAELVGQAIVLEQSTGRVFSRLCDASFGDARCGLNPADFAEGSACGKTVSECRDRFDNVANFRGFPYLIGEDAAYAGPGKDEPMDGGSRYS